MMMNVTISANTIPNATDEELKSFAALVAERLHDDWPGFCVAVEVTDAPRTTVRGDASQSDVLHFILGDVLDGWLNGERAL